MRCSKTLFQPGGKGSAAPSPKNLLGREFTDMLLLGRVTNLGKLF